MHEITHTHKAAEHQNPNLQQTDTLIIAKSILSKSIALNTDVELIRIDIRKSYNRVEHKAVFENMAFTTFRYTCYQLVADISFHITIALRQCDVIGTLSFP